jgi:hypothetical protein
MTPEREAQMRAEAREWALESNIRSEEWRKAHGITEPWPQWQIALSMLGAMFAGALVAALLSFVVVRGCHL